MDRIDEEAGVMTTKRVGVSVRLSLCFVKGARCRRCAMSAMANGSVPRKNEKEPGLSQPRSNLAWISGLDAVCVFLHSRHESCPGSFLTRCLEFHPVRAASVSFLLASCRHKTSSLTRSTDHRGRNRTCHPCWAGGHKDTATLRWRSAA